MIVCITVHSAQCICTKQKISVFHLNTMYIKSKKLQYITCIVISLINMYAQNICCLYTRMSLVSPLTRSHYVNMSTTAHFLIAVFAVLRISKSSRIKALSWIFVLIFICFSNTRFIICLCQTAKSCGAKKGKQQVGCQKWEKRQIIVH